MKGGKGEGGKKEREKTTTEFHSRARTRDLSLCSQPPMATAWRVDSHLRTIHVYIANFDFDDLTVAALAPPISINSDTYACLTFHLDSCRSKDNTVVSGSRGVDCSCSCVGTLQLHGCGFACFTYSANNNTNIPQIPGIQWVLHCTSVILVSWIIVLP